MIWSHLRLDKIIVGIGLDDTTSIENLKKDGVKVILHEFLHNRLPTSKIYSFLKAMFQDGEVTSFILFI